MESDAIQFCTSITPDSVPECDPAWKTETVKALALGILHEQAFDRLPILADALEEAGCQNQDVLGHCRGEVEHFSSCWVIHWLILQDRIAANYQRMLDTENSNVRHEADIQHQAHLVDRKKRIVIFLMLGIAGVGIPGFVLAMLQNEKKDMSQPRMQPAMPMDWRHFRRPEPASTDFQPLNKRLEKSMLQKREKESDSPDLPPLLTEMPPKSK